MTIINGYKEKKDLPDFVLCEFCSEVFAGCERDIRTIYKQVHDDIFTVTICYDCVQILREQGILVIIRDEKLLPPSNTHYEFKDFRIKVS